MAITDEQLEEIAKLFGTMQEGTIGRNYAEVAKECLRLREELEDLRIAEDFAWMAS